MPLKYFCPYYAVILADRLNLSFISYKSSRISCCWCIPPVNLSLDPSRGTLSLGERIKLRHHIPPPLGGIRDLFFIYKYMKTFFFFNLFFIYKYMKNIVFEKLVPEGGGWNWSPREQVPRDLFFINIWKTLFFFFKKTSSWGASNWSRGEQVPRD